MRINDRLKEYVRVLKISKKPSKEEFMFTAKVCAIGTIVVGFVGFVLYLFSVLFIG